MEEWKILKECDNYEISNLGNIRNIKTRRILKQSDDKDGYKIISLSKNNKKYNFRVHRLIALSFIENKENKPLLDHIDRNRQNNKIDNLRWVDAKENSNNKIFKLGISGERNIHINKGIYYVVKFKNDNGDVVFNKCFKTLEEAREAKRKEK
jgi:hypothetical protein